jgi:hypothetical protein
VGAAAEVAAVQSSGACRLAHCVIACVVFGACCRVVYIKGRVRLLRCALLLSRVSVCQWAGRVCVLVGWGTAGRVDLLQTARDNAAADGGWPRCECIVRLLFWQGAAPRVLARVLIAACAHQYVMPLHPWREATGSWVGWVLWAGSLQAVILTADRTVVATRVCGRTQCTLECRMAECCCVGISATM